MGGCPTPRENSVICAYFNVKHLMERPLAGVGHSPFLKDLQSNLPSWDQN